MDNIVTNNWQILEDAFLKEKNNFDYSLNNPYEAQINILNSIIKYNKNTEFGIKHNFPSIASYQNFIEKVPVCEYRDIEYWIEKIKNGEDNILMPEKPFMFELTSGTSAATKYIPYNYHSINSFQKAIFPWLGDLLINYPQLKQGKIYCAISPICRNKIYTKGNTPIGIGDDENYFGTELSHYLNRLLITDSDLFKEINYNNWKILTAKILLNANDLTFISIWSPTFLLEILKEIAKLKNTSLDNLNTHKIWPKLKIISCWSDAGSSFFIADLKKLFPNVLIQGKGLLSTEAVITIPYVQAKYPILAINSNFYEFIDLNNNIRLFNELEYGCEYQVIISNFSGLYRYNTKDIVLCCGYYNNIPMLKFLGRKGNVSDICGEKLDEEFVLEILNNIKEINGYKYLSSELKPYPHYVLHIEKFKNEFINLNNLEQKVDMLLSKNIQFSYARKYDQLGKTKVITEEDITSKFIYKCLNNNKIIGTVKVPVLLNNNS